MKIRGILLTGVLGLLLSIPVHADVEEAAARTVGTWHFAKENQVAQLRRQSEFTIRYDECKGTPKGTQPSTDCVIQGQSVLLRYDATLDAFCYDASEILGYWENGYNRPGRVYHPCDSVFEASATETTPTLIVRNTSGKVLYLGELMLARFEKSISDREKAPNSYLANLEGRWSFSPREVIQIEKFNDRNVIITACDLAPLNRSSRCTGPTQLAPYHTELDAYCVDQECTVAYQIGWYANSEWYGARELTRLHDPYFKKLIPNGPHVKNASGYLDTAYPYVGPKDTTAK